MPLSENHAYAVKPNQVESAYIEYGNGAAPMQVSQVNLFELGPIKLGAVLVSSLDLLALSQHRSNIQCKLVQLVRVYSVHMLKATSSYCSRPGFFQVFS